MTSDLENKIVLLSVYGRQLMSNYFMKSAVSNSGLCDLKQGVCKPSFFSLYWDVAVVYWYILDKVYFNQMWRSREPFKRSLRYIWVKGFKNGPSKICGRQPLILLGLFLNTLTHLKNCFTDLWTILLTKMIKACGTAWCFVTHLRTFITYFMPLVSFYTPWKHQKIPGYLMFSRSL